MTSAKIFIFIYLSVYYIDAFSLITGTNWTVA